MRGVLQAANWMTIEELLNPSDKLININEATDKEIYRAMIDSKVQCENAATNNLGNNNVDDDAPIESLCHVMKFSRQRLPSLSTLQS